MEQHKGKENPQKGGGRGSAGYGGGVEEVERERERQKESLQFCQIEREKKPGRYGNRKHVVGVAFLVWRSLQ